MRRLSLDKPLALLIAILVIGGSLIFASAAFGLLARGSQGMTSVFFSHLVLGIGVGLALLTLTCNIEYRIWRRYAPYLFGAALIATALVFVPHLGAEYGGGRRWIIIFGMSFQPSEALKIATIIVSAAYFAGIRGKVESTLYGLGGYVCIMALPVALLVAQPDIGTLGIIAISSLSIFWVSGARKRDILLLAVIGLLAIGILAAIKPYVRDRVETFFNPSQGAQA